MDEYKMIRSIEIILDGTVLGFAKKNLQIAIQDMKQQIPKIQGETEISFAKGYLYGLEKALEMIHIAETELKQ
jgi:hypothetical protein